MVKSTVSSYLRGLVPLGPKKIARMTTNPEKERLLNLNAPTARIKRPVEGCLPKRLKVELVEPLNPMALELERWEKPVSIGLQDQLLSIHREHMEEKATILLDFLERLEGDVHG